MRPLFRSTKFADWLERRLPGMVPFKPMGEENYNYLLKHVYLLPIDAKQLEMLSARSSWHVYPSPGIVAARSVAGRSKPVRAARSVPERSASFFESLREPPDRDDQLLKDNHLVTLPRISSGRFEIRQLPEAFKPTSPVAS